MNIGRSFANFFTNPRIIPIVCLVSVYMFSKLNFILTSRIAWNEDSDESFLSYLPSCIISLFIGSIFYVGLHNQSFIKVKTSVAITISVFIATIYLLIHFILIKKHIKYLKDIPNIVEGLTRYVNANALTSKQLKFVLDFVKGYQIGFPPDVRDLRAAVKILNICEKKHNGAFREFKQQQEEKQELLYQQAYDKYFSEHPELFQNSEQNKLNSALSLFMFSDINELSEEKLKKRYRGLQKSFHADNGGEDELSRKINEAYDLLKQYI